MRRTNNIIFVVIYLFLVFLVEYGNARGTRTASVSVSQTDTITLSDTHTLPDLGGMWQHLERYCYLEQTGAQLVVKSTTASLSGSGYIVPHDTDNGVFRVVLVLGSTPSYTAVDSHVSPVLTLSDQVNGRRVPKVDSLEFTQITPSSASASFVLTRRRFYGWTAAGGQVAVIDSNFRRFMTWEMSQTEHTSAAQLREEIFQPMVVMRTETRHVTGGLSVPSGSTLTVPSVLTSPPHFLGTDVLSHTLESDGTDREILLEMNTPSDITVGLVLAFNTARDCAAPKSCWLISVNGAQYLEYTRTEGCGNVTTRIIENLQTTGDKTTVSVRRCPSLNSTTTSHAPGIAAVVLAPLATRVSSCAPASTSIRVGCSCRGAADGAWCAFNGVCHDNACVQCEVGWTHHNGVCYKVFYGASSLSWYSAERACLFHYGHLVSVMSPEAASFLHAHVRSIHTELGDLIVGTPFWSGATDFDTSRSWKWVSGYNVLSDTLKMHAGSPSSNTSRQCLSIDFSTASGLSFMDEPCGSRRPFICMSPQCVSINWLPPTEVSSNVNIFGVNSSTPTVSGQSTELGYFTFDKGEMTYRLRPPPEYNDAQICYLHRDAAKTSTAACHGADGIDIDVSWGRITVYHQKPPLDATVRCFNYSLDALTGDRYDDDPNFIRAAGGKILLIHSNPVLTTVCDEYAFVRTRFCRVPTTRACGRSWVTYVGPGKASKCLKFFESDSLGFNEAEATCEREGGYLLSVTTEHEEKFVANLIRDEPVKQIWLGLRRTSVGSYEWLDGSLYNFSRWSLNEPAHTHTYLNNGVWFTGGPTTARAFVCQKYAIGSRTPSMTATLPPTILEASPSISVTVTPPDTPTRTHAATPTVSYEKPMSTTETESPTHDDATLKGETRSRTFSPTISDDPSGSLSSSPSPTHDVVHEKSITTTATESVRQTITETLHRSYTTRLSYTTSGTESPQVTPTISWTGSATRSPAPGYITVLPYDTSLLTSRRLATVGFSFSIRIHDDTFYDAATLARSFRVSSDNNDGRGVASLCSIDQCNLRFVAHMPDWYSVDVYIDTDPTFRIYSGEHVALSFNGSAVRTGLEPRLQPIRFYVHPEDECELGCLQLHVSAIIGIIAMCVSTFIGFSAAMLMQLPTLVVLDSFHCYTKEGVPLSFPLHPFQFAVGSSRHRYYLGAAIMNFIMIVVPFCVHLCLALRRRRSGASLVGAMAQMHFPSYSLVHSSILYPGFTLATFKLAFFADDAGVRAMAWLFIITIHVGSIVGYARLFAYTFRSDYTPLSYPRSQPGFLVYMLLPMGIWRDFDKQYAFHSRWKFVYNDYRGGSHRWFGVELVFVTLICAIASIDGWHRETCNVKTAAILVVASLYLMMILVLRPFKIRGLTLINTGFAVSIVLAFSLRMWLRFQENRGQDTKDLSTYVLFASAFMHMCVFSGCSLRYVYRRFIEKKEIRRPGEPRSILDAARHPSHHRPLDRTSVAERDLVEMKATQERRDVAFGEPYGASAMDFAPEPRKTVWATPWGRIGAPQPLRTLLQPLIADDATPPLRGVVHVDEQATEDSSAPDGGKGSRETPLVMWNEIQRGLDAIGRDAPSIPVSRRPSDVGTHKEQRTDLEALEDML